MVRMSVAGVHPHFAVQHKTFQGSHMALKAFATVWVEELECQELSSYILQSGDLMDIPSPG